MTSSFFRHYIGVDVRGAEVPVLRSDLMNMVDTSESARIKLFKNIEVSSTRTSLCTSNFKNGEVSSTQASLHGSNSSRMFR